jgi:hypothetical protein
MIQIIYKYLTNYFYSLNGLVDFSEIVVDSHSEKYSSLFSSSLNIQSEFVIINFSSIIFTTSVVIVAITVFISVVSGITGIAGVVIVSGIVDVVDIVDVVGVVGVVGVVIIFKI